jgi:hypothetical protein
MNAANRRKCMKKLFVIGLALLALAGCEQEADVSSDATLRGTISIRGTPMVGRTLSVVGNLEVNNETAETLYQWQRKNTGEEDWQVIGTATDSRYKPSQDDVGHSIKVTVSVTGYKNSIDGEASGRVAPAGSDSIYTVDIKPSEHGSVSADPETSLAWDFVTLTAAPDNNYRLKDLTVKAVLNGDIVTVTRGETGNTYIFEMPDDDVTVTAQFAEKAPTYGISWYEDKHGVVAALNWYSEEVTEAEEEDTISLKAKPIDGYMLKAGSLNVTRSDGKPLTLTPNVYDSWFKMPPVAITITAEFMPIDTSTPFDIDSVGYYLETVSGGESPNDPIQLAVSINYPVDWYPILKIIGAKRKYVALNMSASNMNSEKEFHTKKDTGSQGMGKEFIVSMVLPDEATGIAPLAGFGTFVELKSVSGKNIESIGDRAFWNSTWQTFQTFNFPKLKSIGEYAFYMGTSMEEVKIPATVETIGKNPFAGCSSSSVITVDAGNTHFKFEDGKLLTMDGKRLIWYPSASGAVSLDPSITTVDAFALYHCYISSVTGEGVETIGDEAFYDCAALKTVNFPKAKSIGQAAFARTALKTITTEFPNVESIGLAAFSNCPGLTEVTLPKLEDVGNSAFFQCYALKTVELPRAKTIQNSAFNYCSALESLYLPSSPPKLMASAFIQTQPYMETVNPLNIYVPQGTKAAYLSAWGVQESTSTRRNVTKYGINHKAINIVEQAGP